MFSRLAIGTTLALALVGCGAKPLVHAVAPMAGHLGARAIAWPPATMTATVETISGGHAETDAGYAVDVPAAEARYALPNGVAYANGKLYVSDARNNVITTIADRAGTLFASSFVGSPHPDHDQDGTGAQALFTDPQDLEVGPDGNLYLVEYHSDMVRSISPAGVAKTVVKATGEHPTMWAPYGIAVGASGTLYVSDLDRKQVLKLTRSGASWKQTVLYRAKTDADPVPMGLTVDEQENVYFSSGYALWSMTSAGASLTKVIQHLPKFTWDLAYANHHVVAAALTLVLDIDLVSHTVTTLAGNGTIGGADGVGPAATFGDAASICFGEANTLYVADSANHRICKLTF